MLIKTKDTKKYRMKKDARMVKRMVATGTVIQMLLKFINHTKDSTAIE